MALARSERRFGYEASEDRVHGVILIRVHSRSVTRPPPHGGQTALNPELEHPMPLARIDLIKGKLETYRQAIGEAVYQALLSIGVPEDDRFQVISEHEPADFIFAKSYLGIEHTDDLVIIQITFNEGRTTAQKQVLFKAIAEGIRAATGLGINDVFVNLVEVKRENWSFGNGVAQYAST
jgi:4-oxalocrotonate tautomerase